MIKPLATIPLYKAFHAFGYPRQIPLNVTISLLYRCNSTCATCNVYERPAEELTVEEYDKIFRSMGRRPYWFTFSGGEPFLRPDISEIISNAYRQCRPGIINIPTNGILCKVIPREVERISRACPGSQLQLNISLDAIGEEHDKIRGVRRNYELALKTFREIRKLDLPNMVLGIHTVISRFNVEKLPEISKELLALEPDSYITEIAENRAELWTEQIDIEPDEDQYTRAVEEVSRLSEKAGMSGTARITRGFRLEYYRIVKEWQQERKQVIPCYAGWASTQIAADGDVWTCCVLAKSIGNLRDHNYDFASVWGSADADVLRASIKRGDCHCPLANASYTNMLHHPGSLSRVIGRIIKA